MPKKSDTTEKVQSAADTLLAQGKRPTQQAVRDLLGTGSITTINHALNLWWANLSKRINRQSEHPALPDPVITAASKLWDQALVYAEASLDSQREEISRAFEQQRKNENGQLIQVQGQLVELQQQNNRLLKANEDLLFDKNALAQKNHQLESDLIKSMAASDELKRDVKQQQILLDKQPTARVSELDTHKLLEAQVSLKVTETLVADLKTEVLAKHENLSELQQKLFDQEKSYLKQIHRLELVIAQQDAKYNNVKQQLDKYELSVE
jgi:hypothetical protein